MELKKGRKKKKSLYEPRKLTYDEHKKLHDFLSWFHSEGKDFFDLLRQGFGDNKVPVKNFANVINLMQPMKMYLESKVHKDRPYPLYEPETGFNEELKKWYSLYQDMGYWITEGWSKR